MSNKAGCGCLTVAAGFLLIGALVIGLTPTPAAKDVGVIGRDTMSGYDPTNPDPDLTPAERYKADIGFWANSASAKVFILSSDTETFYDTLNHACNVMDNKLVTLELAENMTADVFRKNGLEEEAANDASKAYWKVTLKECQAL